MDHRDENGPPDQAEASPSLEGPEYGRLRAEIEQWIRYGMANTTRIYSRVAEKLSPSDRPLFVQYGLEVPEDDARCRIRKQFDEVILQQARAVGPQIFLSHVVIRRLHEWFKIEQNGPELLERLGKQLAWGARVKRGDSTFPLDDPQLYLVNKDLMREVRLLLRGVREELDRTNSIPQKDELLDGLQKRIVNPARSFPRLFENWGSVRQFLQSVNGRPLLLRIATGKATPSEFVAGWWASISGHPPDYARKAISKLGNRRAVR